MPDWAVLVAAGRGERLGTDRQSVRSARRPAHARGKPRRLDHSEWVDAIVVVAPPGWEEPGILLAEEIGAAKVTAVVTGGATRQLGSRGDRRGARDAGRTRPRRGKAPPRRDVIGRVLARSARASTGPYRGAVADTVKRIDGDSSRDAGARRARRGPDAAGVPAAALRSAYAGDGGRNRLCVAGRAPVGASASWRATRAVQGDDAGGPRAGSRA